MIHSLQWTTLLLRTVERAQLRSETVQNICWNRAGTDPFVAVRPYILFVQPRKHNECFNSASPFISLRERGKKDSVCTGIYLITGSFLVQGMVLLTASSGLCLLCHRDNIRTLCLLGLKRRQQTLDVKSGAATHTDGSHVFQWHNLFGESQNCCQPSHLAEQPVKVHTDISLVQHFWSDEHLSVQQRASVFSGRVS